MAEQEGLDIGEAHHRLLDVTSKTGRSLTEVAQSLIESAQEPGV